MNPLSIALAVLGGTGAIAGDFYNSKRQYEQNKKLQNAQFEFNRTEAEKAYQRALEMNEITYQQNSIQNKVGQMKEAGLNPALMYGGGAGNAGGAGSASTGAQATGSASSVSRGNYAESMGIAMQLAQLKANVKKTEAEANLADTQAEKLAGADTNKINAEIQNLGETRAGQKLQNIFDEIRNDVATTTKDANINEIKARSIEQVEDAFTASARRAIAEADAQVAEATINARTESAYEHLANLQADKILKFAQIAYTDEQRKALAEQLKINWAQVANGKITAEAAAKNASTNEAIFNWEKDTKFPQESKNERRGQTFRLIEGTFGAIINIAGSVLLRTIPQKYNPTQESYSETTYDKKGEVKSTTEGSKAKY